MNGYKLLRGEAGCDTLQICQCLHSTNTGRERSKDPREQLYRRPRQGAGTGWISLGKTLTEEMFSH